MIFQAACKREGALPDSFSDIEHKSDGRGDTHERFEQICDQVILDLVTEKSYDEKRNEPKYTYNKALDKLLLVFHILLPKSFLRIIS